MIYTTSICYNRVWIAAIKKLCNSNFVVLICSCRLCLQRPAEMETLQRYCCSTVKTVLPSFRKCKLLNYGPVQSARLMLNGVHAFACVRKVAGYPSQFKQTVQCPPVRSSTVHSSANIMTAASHTRCKLAHIGSLGGSHRFHWRQYSNRNKRSCRSRLYPAVGLASAAACLVPDSSDENSYFGVLAHEIER